MDTLTKPVRFSDVTEDGTYLVDAHGDLHRMKYDTGYMVGVKPLTPDTFEEELPKLTLVGRWTDHKSGFDWDSGYDVNENVIYWDEVQLIEGLTAALDVARERGELAVWDNLNNNEIRV